MTARDDLYDALVDGDGRIETQLRAKQLLDAYRDQVLQLNADVLHFSGRPAPGESGYARDQLIVAFRGGEESEFSRYGWGEAVMMADRVVRSLRVEVGRENAERLRRLPIDDPFLRGQRDALADLIDPDKQEAS
jgi:hypothetical protein